MLHQVCQMAELRIEKTIRLMRLEPENYRLWAAQFESTFSVLKIVFRHELNPVKSVQTPSDESEAAVGDAEIAPIIAEAQRRSITKWEHRHDLARQALLASLKIRRAHKGLSDAICTGDLSSSC
jgi:hypothetical protein